VKLGKEEKRKVKKDDSNNENEKALPLTVRRRNGDLFIRAGGCQLSQDWLCYME
jgi:hypothetical protein